MKILGKEISKKVFIELIIAILVVGGISTVIIINNSKSVKGSISSMENLRFILPDEFRFSYSEKNEDQYEYESSKEWCTFNVSIEYDYSSENDDEIIEKNIYSNVRHRLNLGVYEDIDLENIELNTKKINKHEWTTCSISDDNIYIFKDKEKIYKVEFSGKFSSSSRNSYCLKAYNTVINSLDFK